MAAATERPTSRVDTAVTGPADETMARGEAAGLTATLGATAAGKVDEAGAEGPGRATLAPEVPEAGGVGALTARGAAEVAAAVALGELPGGGGPPAGTDGSLMVAELGFGGRLMRTVSFLGWTFAASAGLGGTPPSGGLDSFSAIS